MVTEIAMQVVSVPTQDENRSPKCSATFDMESLDGSTMKSTKMFSVEHCDAEMACPPAPLNITGNWETSTTTTTTQRARKEIFRGKLWLHIHPYGRYGNAVKTRKTISTIAILCLACQGHFREEGHYGGGRYFHFPWSHFLCWRWAICSNAFLWRGVRGRKIHREQAFSRWTQEGFTAEPPRNYSGAIFQWSDSGCCLEVRTRG